MRFFLTFTHLFSTYTLIDFNRNSCLHKYRMNSNCKCVMVWIQNTIVHMVRKFLFVLNQVDFIQSLWFLHQQVYFLPQNAPTYMLIRCLHVYHFLGIFPTYTFIWYPRLFSSKEYSCLLYESPWSWELSPISSYW